MPRKKKQRPVDATNVSTDATHRASSQTPLTETEQTNAVSTSPKTSAVGNGSSDAAHDSAVDDVRVGFDDVVDQLQQRRSRLRQHSVSDAAPTNAGDGDAQDSTDTAQRPRARRTHRSGGDSELLTHSQAARRRRRRQREEQRKAMHEDEARNASDKDSRNGTDGTRRAVHDGKVDANDVTSDGGAAKPKRHVVQDRHHYEHRVERRESLSVRMDADLYKALQDVDEISVNGCRVSVGHMYNVELMVNGDPNDIVTAMRVRTLMGKIDNSDLSSLPPDDLADAVALTKSVHMTNMNVIIMRTVVLPVGDSALMRENDISVPELIAPDQAFLMTFLGFDGVMYENVSTVVSASELEMSVTTYDKVDEIIEKYSENEKGIRQSFERLMQLRESERRLEMWIDKGKIRQTMLLSDLADVIGVSPMPACNRAFYTVLNTYLDKATEIGAEIRKAEEKQRNDDRRRNGVRGRRTRRHTTKANVNVVAAKIMCMSTGDSSGEMSCNMSVTLNRGGIVNGQPASDQTVRGFCVIRLDGIDRTPLAYAQAAKRLLAGDSSFITVVSGNGDAFTGAGDDDNNGEGEKKDFLHRFVDAVIGNEVKRRSGK